MTVTRDIIKSFKAPLSDNLVDSDGRLTRQWEWFLKEIETRLRGLGEEKVHKLINNMQALSFATSDVNTTTDTITETAHPFYTGLKGRFTTTGTLPSGLSLATDYYIIEGDANTYKVASSYANASSGTNIDLTSTGSGTHTFTPYANIDGAVFDKSGTGHVIFEYLCQRVTTGGGAVELTEMGILVFVYEPTSATWTKVTVSEHNPDNAGLTLDIDSLGQVYYTTSNVGGTASQSSLYWRARTLSAKHINYSTINR